MSRMTLAIFEEALPPSLTWRQKLDAAAKAGYDAIELSIADGEGMAARLDMPYGLRRAIRDFESDTGVKIGSICLSALQAYPLGSPEPAVRKRGADILRSTIKLAENMRINLIQIAGCAAGGTDGEGAKCFEENLAAAVEYAAASGVVIALGTGGTTVMNTVSKAAEIVRRIDMPNFGLYPDIGSLYVGLETREGADMPGGLASLAASDLESGRGRIFAAQMKESRPGTAEGLLPGEGRVDFNLMTAKLYELGIRRFTAVQRYTDDRAGCWEEDLKRTAAIMRGAWSKRKVGASLGANGD